MKCYRTAAILAIISITGCSSFLPEKVIVSNSQWESFDAVKASFGSIAPGITTVQDLKDRGVDLETMPNTKQLTYIEVARRFGMIGVKPDPRIKIPRGVILLVQAGERGKAYSLKVSNISTKREGNLFLDVLRFKRIKHKTGWEYEVLIITVDNVIEYVLYAGNPNVDVVESEKNPLGPFNSIDAGTVIKAVK
jgi:hypothetical protein